MKIFELYKRAIQAEANLKELLSCAVGKLFSLVGLIILSAILISGAGHSVFVLLYYIVLTISLCLCVFIVVIDPFLMLRNIKNATKKADVFYVIIFLVLMFAALMVALLISEFLCFKANPSCSIVRFISDLYHIPQNINYFVNL